MLYKSSLFNHDKEEKSFSAFASDIDFRFVDSFEMKSEKTNEIVIFFLDKMHRNNDNDITHVVYVPSATSKVKFPKLANYTVTIWNT